MANGKYTPNKTSYSLKTHEAKNKDQWFDYDPYDSERVHTKPYAPYSLDYNPLLVKAPLRVVIPIPDNIASKSMGNLVFGYLLNIIYPIFTEIKLGISNTVHLLLSKIKRKP